MDKLFFAEMDKQGKEYAAAYMRSRGPHKNMLDHKIIEVKANPRTEIKAKEGGQDGGY